MTTELSFEGFVINVVFSKWYKKQKKKTWGRDREDENGS